MTEQEIRDLFKSKDVPLGVSDVWKVQQALVVKHKALERLAATLKVRYAPAQILRAERDEAVILVTGSIGELSEWSIGEACIGLNYQVSGKQAGYPYAMAEKRAKDRVILKLAGLHGAYSEDEADDFRAQTPDSQDLTSSPEMMDIYKRLKDKLEKAGSTLDVDNILRLESDDIASLSEEMKGRLRHVVRFVREALKVAA